MEGKLLRIIVRRRGEIICKAEIRGHGSGIRGFVQEFSRRPYGTAGQFGDAYPGLRFAPPGATLLRSLREGLAVQAGALRAWGFMVSHLRKIREGWGTRLRAQFRPKRGEPQAPRVLLESGCIARLRSMQPQRTFPLVIPSWVESQCPHQSRSRCKRPYA